MQKRWILGGVMALSLGCGDGDGSDAFNNESASGGQQDDTGVAPTTGLDVGHYNGLTGPYTYSDMTGYALGNVICPPEG